MNQYLGLCLRINDSGVFACIRLTALWRAYFHTCHIKIIHVLYGLKTTHNTY